MRVISTTEKIYFLTDKEDKQCFIAYIIYAFKTLKFGVLIKKFFKNFFTRKNQIKKKKAKKHKQLLLTLYTLFIDVNLG